jgi:hypothetical protein
VLNVFLGLIVAKKKKSSPSRGVLVFSTLVGILSLTSVVLLLLAPAPLVPGAAESLFAVDSPDAVANLFRTQKSLANWNYIFIHHSGNSAGKMNGDHFTIGNGSELEDGELQISQRWMEQSPATPAGVKSLATNCISICVTGDFDESKPTQVQLRRLEELTSALQSKFHITSDHILFVQGKRTPAGIGRNFPIEEFRQQIAQ